MTKDTMVFWSTKRLSKEFDIHPTQVALLLKALGAKRWSRSQASNNSTWYWDSEETEQ